ncbi:MAG: UDP-N-acetylmuramoyl-L-alanyl-D-glutamate--2,6-diaminopimelate ligase [Acidobacteriota bacterium]
MTIRDLLAALELSGLLAPTGPSSADSAWLDGRISQIASDSRAVTPGSVFAALRGARANGVTFAAQAAANGAVAVLADQDRPPGVMVPWILVTDARRALARAADTYYGQPSRDLTVVGITGTNGKTTTAYLVRGMFEAAGRPCGLIGTVQYLIGQQARDASRTTPEATDLQRMLREMCSLGSRACAMEVSSHALALHRVDDVRFSAALFTNLTRDHLDFHGSMDHYFAAKRRLFEMLPASAPGIFNVDDRRGAVLARECSNRITFAVETPADVTPGPVLPSLGGLQCEIRTPAGVLSVRSRLIGRFNLYNLLGAAAAGVALGLPADAIERGLWEIGAVPGRLQIVSSADDDLSVIVDYAHTDDALRNLLEAVRPLATGRLITVFGCGGDRDRTKRPLMGAVAAQLSDLVVLTSDNPRSEDPDVIIDDIERGLLPHEDRHAGPASGGWWPTDRRAAYARLADRRAAIGRAIADGERGDLVVIAGRGHETYQESGGRIVPFDDAEVAQAALGARRRARAS